MKLIPPADAVLKDDTELVPAWKDMSDSDKANHLVYEHGFDSKYFQVVDSNYYSSNRYDGSMGDEQVVFDFTYTGFHELNATSQGYSFPCQEGRDTWHDEDHAEHQYGGNPRCPHVHAERVQPGMFDSYGKLFECILFGVGAFVSVFILLWAAWQLGGMIR